MTRFKTIKKDFTSLPNSVIQGFYLTPNALAVLITCLSYPNDWEYRPIAIWKNLKLSRDKTYAAFDELVEKGHCIRIRTLRGNLRAEVDYIFFDEIVSCQQYIKDNNKELSSKNLEIEHKWNFKKCFRHPEPQEPEGREPEGQEVTKKIENKKIVKKRYNKESKTPIVHNSADPEPPDDSIVSPSATAAQGSILFTSENSVELSSPEVVEILSLEYAYKKYFRPSVVSIWIKKYGPTMTLETIRYFFKTKLIQQKPIDSPEKWMEKAFQGRYSETAQTCEKNKKFAENLKKKYNLSNLKINKRYCFDTEVEKDYYYNLPEKNFQEILLHLYGIHHDKPII